MSLFSFYISYLVIHCNINVSFHLKLIPLNPISMNLLYACMFYLKHIKYSEASLLI